MMNFNRAKYLELHIYVPHLEEHLDELDKNQAIATYCGSGYRASIAASLLKLLTFLARGMLGRLRG
ncbi:rhodanese-like domain-containing protein [Chlorogloeopsis sp. ULAP02]|uniref:rhodanese-like domain-containing protein n=1 Tax=Chlorogloeopsis sp. ULAP02 TaxID=3107926 RepID=UPI00398B771F